MSARKVGSSRSLFVSQAHNRQAALVLGRQIRVLEKNFQRRIRETDREKRNLNLEMTQTMMTTGYSALGIQPTPEEEPEIVASLRRGISRMDFSLHDPPVRWALESPRSRLVAMSMDSSAKGFNSILGTTRPLRMFSAPPRIRTSRSSSPTSPTTANGQGSNNSLSALANNKLSEEEEDATESDNRRKSTNQKQVTIRVITAPQRRLSVMTLRGGASAPAQRKDAVPGSAPGALPKREGSLSEQRAQLMQRRQSRPEQTLFSDSIGQNGAWAKRSAGRRTDTSVMSTKNDLPLCSPRPGQPQLMCVKS
ncbi:Hypp8884 [Branchiostoma lanceolatum]|uniref:Hypp8884 protein n=1 Tax=Branchiostoma lanceolatum TaxID=7740 RepID=A0A8J9ZCC7_BRALA|nr:Hypp8884 [Branchiostoma lanceolatum]